MENKNTNNPSENNINQQNNPQINNSPEQYNPEDLYKLYTTALTQIQLQRQQDISSTPITKNKVTSVYQTPQYGKTYNTVSSINQVPNWLLQVSYFPTGLINKHISSLIGSDPTMQYLYQMYLSRYIYNLYSTITGRPITYNERYGEYQYNPLLGQTLEGLSKIAKGYMEHSLSLLGEGTKEALLKGGQFFLRSGIPILSGLAYSTSSLKSTLDLLNRRKSQKSRLEYLADIYYQSTMLPSRLYQAGSLYSTILGELGFTHLSPLVKNFFSNTYPITQGVYQGWYELFKHTPILKEFLGGIEGLHNIIGQPFQHLISMLNISPYLPFGTMLYGNLLSMMPGIAESLIPGTMGHFLSSALPSLTSAITYGGTYSIVGLPITLLRIGIQLFRKISSQGIRPPEYVSGYEISKKLSGAKYLQPYINVILNDKQASQKLSPLEPFMLQILTMIEEHTSVLPAIYEILANKFETERYSQEVGQQTYKDDFKYYKEKLEEKGTWDILENTSTFLAKAQVMLNPFAPLYYMLFKGLSLKDVFKMIDLNKIHKQQIREHVKTYGVTAKTVQLLNINPSNIIKNIPTPEGKIVTLLTILVDIAKEQLKELITIRTGLGIKEQVSMQLETVEGRKGFDKLMLILEQSAQAVIKPIQLLTSTIKGDWKSVKAHIADIQGNTFLGPLLSTVAFATTGPLIAPFLPFLAAGLGNIKQLKNLKDTILNPREFLLDALFGTGEQVEEKNLSDILSLSSYSRFSSEKQAEKISTENTIFQGLTKDYSNYYEQMINILTSIDNKLKDLVSIHLISVPVHIADRCIGICDIESSISNIYTTAQSNIVDRLEELIKEHSTPVNYNFTISKTTPIYKDEYQYVTANINKEDESVKNKEKALKLKLPTSTTITKTNEEKSSLNTITTNKKESLSNILTSSSEKGYITFTIFEDMYNLMKNTVKQIRDIYKEEKERIQELDTYKESTDIEKQIASGFSTITKIFEKLFIRDDIKNKKEGYIERLENKLKEKYKERYQSISKHIGYEEYPNIIKKTIALIDTLLPDILSKPDKFEKSVTDIINKVKNISVDDIINAIDSTTAAIENLDHAVKQKINNIKSKITDTKNFINQIKEKESETKKNIQTDNHIPEFITTTINEKLQESLSKIIKLSKPTEQYDFKKYIQLSNTQLIDNLLNSNITKSKTIENQKILKDKESKAIKQTILKEGDKIIKCNICEILFDIDKQLRNIGLQLQLMNLNQSTTTTSISINPSDNIVTVNERLIKERQEDITKDLDTTAESTKKLSEYFTTGQFKHELLNSLYQTYILNRFNQNESKETSDTENKKDDSGSNFNFDFKSIKEKFKKGLSKVKELSKSSISKIKSTAEKVKSSGILSKIKNVASFVKDKIAKSGIAKKIAVSSIGGALTTAGRLATSVGRLGLAAAGSDVLGPALLAAAAGYGIYKTSRYVLDKTGANDWIYEHITEPTIHAVKKISDTGHHIFSFFKKFFSYNAHQRSEIADTLSDVTQHKKTFEQAINKMYDEYNKLSHSADSKERKKARELQKITQETLGNIIKFSRTKIATKIVDTIDKLQNKLYTAKTKDEKIRIQNLIKTMKDYLFNQFVRYIGGQDKYEDLFEYFDKNTVIQQIIDRVHEFNKLKQQLTKQFMALKKIDYILKTQKDKLSSYQIDKLEQAKEAIEKRISGTKEYLSKIDKLTGLKLEEQIIRESELPAQKLSETIKQELQKIESAPNEQTKEKILHNIIHNINQDLRQGNIYEQIPEDKTIIHLFEHGINRLIAHIHDLFHH